MLAGSLVSSIINIIVPDACCLRRCSDDPAAMRAILHSMGVRDYDEAALEALIGLARGTRTQPGIGQWLCLAACAAVRAGNG
jgi:hypothetical protein